MEDPFAPGIGLGHVKVLTVQVAFWDLLQCKHFLHYHGDLINGSWELSFVRNAVVDAFEPALIMCLLC